MTMDVYDQDDDREVAVRVESEVTEAPIVAPRRRPVYATVTVRQHDRRPIVPAALRDRDERRALVRHVGGRTLHASAYHGLRVPMYVPSVIGWVLRGMIRVVRQFTWWAYDREHASVRAEAIRTLNMAEARAQYRQRQHRVRWRGGVYWATVAAVAVAGVAGWVLLPVALLLVGGLALGVVLAYVGRPHGRPAFVPAVIRTEYRKLTSDMVEAALLAAGLAKLDKEGKHALRWVQPPQRDGNGYLAVIDLPPGTTFGQAMDSRAQIASGLHVAVEQVWPERDKTSERRLRLWVGDQPMSEVTPPAWPLLRTGRVDLFGEFPFGINARGRTASMCLMYSNLLVGAIPGQGKSFAARLAALAAALDPTAELHVADLKGGADWLCFDPIAYSLIVGDQPADIEALMADLREVRREMQRRYLVLQQLARAKDPRAPEGKVTRDLAADKPARMHPVVVVIDECQVIFAKSCEYAGEAAELLTDVVKRGRAVGVIAILATQKPDKDSLPTGIRDNVGTRFGLRVLTPQASDMVLGGGMSVAGYRAHNFTRADLGVGYLVGASTTADAEIVKTFNVSGAQADVVTARARLLRENTGTLTGHAAGIAPVRRSTLLDDVLAVMAGDRQHCAPLAETLAAAYPEQYAGWDATRLGGALRGQGVTVRQIRVGRVGGVVGVTRTDVERAVKAQQTG